MTKMMPLVRIVDDDAPFRTSQAMLLRMSGRDVAEYATAQEFLARDDSSRPGCLILDVRMPGMTGLELQQALEMTGSTLPVIFLTGHGDVSMAVHTMRHGAADFLEKPVMPAVLFASVERACRRSMALYESMLKEREERSVFYRLTPR
ncbi:MAG: response regulator transcription factor, partial [Sutterella sp.]